MGRCPWHGNPCDCDGYADLHAGRPAKWSPINGIAPPWCEQRIPLEVVGAYIQPPRVSAVMLARYSDWDTKGRPRLYGEDDPEEEPTFRA